MAAHKVVERQLIKVLLHKSETIALGGAFFVRSLTRRRTRRGEDGDHGGNLLMGQAMEVEKERTDPMIRDPSGCAVSSSRF